MGVNTPQTQHDFEEKINETKQLVKAANGEVVAVLTQKRPNIDNKTALGMGKVLELKELVVELGVNSVLFNMELSGSQIKNLESICEVKVLDRTMLILDIFASRATTLEGKLQVELAMHQYRLPRLSQNAFQYSRLGGGIGTRGPGESQLETDRRHILREIKSIKKRLQMVQKHRKLISRRRKRSDLPLVCLLGYTNAGKSSILNQMIEFSSSNLKVGVKDMPFASLQPFTRRIDNEVQTFLMSDTVGFVSDLPTHLVEAFHSSIEEIEFADVLIHVVDASSKQIETHLKTVSEILKDIDLTNKTVITYFNKMDKADKLPSDVVEFSNITMYGSAFKQDDMKKLLNTILECVVKI